MIPQGNGYRTTSPLMWEIGRTGSGLTYEVPVGSWFDVSIPRPVRWLFDPHDPRYLRAAALHDHMLMAGWDRLVAGAVFNDVLRADGVGKPTRFIMWIAVSLWKWN